MLAIIAAFLPGLWGQAAPISFRVENVLSHVPNPPFTPWMFDLDDPAYFTSDGNPFTCVDDPDSDTHKFAYYDFTTFMNFLYESHCTAENLDFVNGTEGFDIQFTDFTLAGFHKVNTEDPDAAWNVPGQAGDVRTYINGVCELWHNEALVLRLTGCVLNVNVHYPTATQIRQQMGLQPHQWVTDIGTGEPTEVSAWGTLDILHSDPTWAGEFTNFAAGNRVEFVMSTIDLVMQGPIGLYSFDLDLKKAAFPIEHDHVNLMGIGEYDLQNVYFNYTAMEQGGPHGDLNDLVVQEKGHEILGGLPEQVDEAHPRSWQFATTLKSFNADISFNLEGYGFGTSDQWVVLRKKEFSPNWQIWPFTNLIDEHTIQARNVTAFSEWAIGRLRDDTLPVQLSSFTASATGTGSINILWTTQSESNLIGFRILRAESQDLSFSSLISPLISATNLSTTFNYRFQDTDVVPNNRYYYWLEALDLDGNTTYHGPVSAYCSEPNTDTDAPELNLTSGIRSIYPNPGSRQSIQIYLEKKLDFTMDIYNRKGQKVKTIFQGSQTEGIHCLHWDGSNDLGKELPTGLYFVSLTSEGKSLGRRKISLIK